VLGLQQEIQRSEESRYDHRLHGVLLVAQGMTCPEVARLLGDAPRSVENWVHRFDQEGLSGLTEGERSGRPSRLCLHNRYFGLLDGAVAAVENRFAEWIKPNDTLRRLCALT